MLTSYCLKKLIGTNSNKFLKGPALLTVDKLGIITKSKENLKFLIDGVVFTRLRRDCVVNSCPYIPVNDSHEDSCYSNLLLHVPWPLLGEEFICPSNMSAVQQFIYMRDNCLFPEYVKGALEKFRKSDILRNNVGTLINTDDSTENESNNIGEEDHVDNSINFIGFISEQNLPNELSNAYLGCNNGVLKNITLNQKMFLESYIIKQQRIYMNNLCENNVYNSSNEISNTNTNTNCEGLIITPVNDYVRRNNILQQNVSLLTTKQLEAYNIAVDYISGKNSNQMLMFVSGEGGTGKSFLISLVMEYTNLLFGKQKGIYGAAIAVAPTGCAASVIKGFTWHSVYGKTRKTVNENNNDFMAASTAQAIGGKISGVRLIVIDEISMISAEQLYEISQRHISAMKTTTFDELERSELNHKFFGGTHVLFTGDFYQLKSIGSKPIYSTQLFKENAIKGRNIWLSLNQYIELTENTRYRDDATPHMNIFLKGARIGQVDKSLLLLMNERLSLSEECAMIDAGPDAVWIAHTNAEVNKLNKSDFANKQASGVQCYRIWADHTPTEGVNQPSPEDIINLCQITRKEGLARFVDLAIGTRVSCTINLGTQVGTLCYVIYY